MIRSDERTIGIFMWREISTAIFPGIAMRFSGSMVHSLRSARTLHFLSAEPVRSTVCRSDFSHNRAFYMLLWLKNGNPLPLKRRLHDLLMNRQLTYILISAI